MLHPVQRSEKTTFWGSSLLCAFIALQNRDGCDRMVCWSLMSLIIDSCSLSIDIPQLSSGQSHSGTPLLIWGVHTSDPQLCPWNNVLCLLFLPHSIPYLIKVVGILRYYGWTEHYNGKRNFSLWWSRHLLNELQMGSSPFWNLNSS